MQRIQIKTTGLKLWSSKRSRTRNNQTIIDYYSSEEYNFKNQYEAYLYFKDYYLWIHNYNGSLKVKIL